MKPWEDNVYFILVEPREPGNIGASARAIKNMGFRNLCLVNPPGELTDDARRMACNALDVLDSAQIYPDFRSAVRDKSIVMGTSRRTGRRRGVIVPVEEGAKSIFEHARKGKVAILFGREDRGLFNEEVEECGLLLTIPTSREHRSLNLSQAVLIVAYELLKTGYGAREGNASSRPSGPRRGRAAPATHKDLTVLYRHIEEALKGLEYIPRGDRDIETKIMQNMKHLIGRAGLTNWELRMLHGICSQVKTKISAEEN